MAGMVVCPRCRKKSEPGQGQGMSCPGCGQTLAVAATERQAAFVNPAAVTAKAPSRRGRVSITEARGARRPRNAVPRALLVAGIVLVAACGVAAFEVLRPAGPSTAAQAPLWKVGYRWTYEVAIGASGDGPDGLPMTAEVTGVARVSVVHPYACVPWPCAYAVRSAFAVGKDGRSEFAAVEKDTLGWREESTFSHPPIPFPLETGDRGQIAGYTYSVTYAGPVAVQAGTFLAHRIAYSNDEGQVVVVYAPEVRAPLRVESTAAGSALSSRYVAELSSFEL